jgi:hypothetical protein
MLQETISLFPLLYATRNYKPVSSTACYKKLTISVLGRRYLSVSLLRELPEKSRDRSGRDDAVKAWVGRAW